jgi:hypothetical protein
MLCALVFMHVVQEAELKQLRHDLNQEIQLREVR